MAELAVFVGERIRLLRRHRGLTQEALAERIGVTSESVSNIERAVHPPSLETLERILTARLDAHCVPSLSCPLRRLPGN
jgi:transcriptional regulator with XRE-family HTH domain